MNKLCTIKVRGAGRYNGEYAKDEEKTVVQELDEWEARLRSVGCNEAQISVGYFTFGKGDGEEGRFWTHSTRELRSVPA